MGRWFCKAIISFYLFLLSVMVFCPTPGLGLSFLWAGPVIFSVPSGIIYSPIIKTDYHSLLLYRPILLVKTKLGPYLPYQSEKDWVSISIAPVKFLESFRFRLIGNYRFPLSGGNSLLVYSKSNVDVLSGLPDFDSAFVKASFVFSNLRDQESHLLGVDLSGQTDLDLKAKVGVLLKHPFYNSYGIGFRRCQGLVLLPQGRFHLFKGQMQVISGHWMDFLCTDKGCKITGSVDRSDLEIKIDGVSFNLDRFEVRKLKGRATVKVAEMLSIDGAVELKGKDWIVKDLNGMWQNGDVEIQIEGGNINLTTGDGWLDVRADVEVKDVGRFRFKGKVGIKGYRVEGVLGPVRRRNEEVSLSWKGGRVNIMLVSWRQFGVIPVELKQVMEVGREGLRPIKKKLRFLSPAVSVDGKVLWVGGEKITNWHKEVNSLSDWRILIEKGQWPLEYLGRVLFDRFTLFPHKGEIHAFFKGNWRPFSEVSLPVEGDAVLSLYGLSSLRLFAPNLELHVSFERGLPKTITGWVKLKHTVLERVFFDRQVQDDEDVKVTVELGKDGIYFISCDGKWKIKVSDKGVLATSLDWVRERGSKDIMLFGKRERIEFSQECFLLRRSIQGVREVKAYGLSWLRGPGWELISDLGRNFRLDIGFWQAEIAKFDWARESGMVLAIPKADGICIMWPFFVNSLSQIKKTEIYRQDPSGKWKKIAVIRPDLDWLREHPSLFRPLNYWEKLALYLRLLQDNTLAQRLGIGYLDVSLDRDRMYRYKVKVYTEIGEAQFESPSFLSCHVSGTSSVGLYRANFDGWGLVGWKSDIEGCMPVRVGKKTIIWAGSSDMCMVACKGGCGQIRFLDKRLGRYLQKDWSPEFLVKLEKEKRRWANNIEKGIKSPPNLHTRVSFIWKGKKLVGRWQADSSDGLLLFEKVGKVRWVPVGRFKANESIILERSKSRKLCYRLIWLRGIRGEKEEVVKVK